MKYKMCLIAFNFGKLPSYFDLWLKSAERNKNYNFLLYIDDTTQYNFPFNVKVKYITFKECVKKIRNIFDFDIHIPTPYKICDFRPAFGEIFKDDLRGFDFWGTIDFDIILGEIEDFITEDILEKYDKILTRDHFCLYRNTEEINKHYKGKQALGDMLYKKAFTTPYVIAFGERGGYGVYNIWKYNHWKMYDKAICGDVLPGYYHFEYKIEDYSKRERALLFYQDVEGKVYSVIEDSGGNYTKKELMYIHLQKRKMIDMDRIERRKCIVIIPNRIISYDSIDNDFAKLVNEYQLDKTYILDILQKWKWKVYKTQCLIRNKQLLHQYKYEL